MKSYQEANSAIRNYCNSLRVLRSLNILINKKDFTSQIGEWLVCQLYGGEPATNAIQKDWDLLIDEKKVQVKTHA